MLYETDDLCQREIDRGKAELAREQEAHQKTALERDGMQRFLFMATLLLRAESAGKAGTPEYAEMKELALEISAIFERGEVFHGYHDQPEKIARTARALDVPSPRIIQGWRSSSRACGSR